MVALSSFPAIGDPLLKAERRKKNLGYLHWVGAVAQLLQGRAKAAQIMHNGKQKKRGRNTAAAVMRGLSPEELRELEANFPLP